MNLVHRQIWRLCFGNFDTDESLEATLVAMKAARAHGVWLFDSYGHNEPNRKTDAVLAVRSDRMREVVPQFRQVGLTVDVNILATIGMGMSPVDRPPHTFQFMTEEDGRTYPGRTLCPLDPNFRAYCVKLFNNYALPGVDRLWVDDDYTYKGGSQACYCPLHLEMFAKRFGKKLSREELAAIARIPKRSVEQDDIWQCWFEVTKDALLETAAYIRAGVDARIPIGMMGMNDKASRYGLDFIVKLARTWAGNHPAAIRPEFECFGDWTRASWKPYYLPVVPCAVGGRAESFAEVEPFPWHSHASSARSIGYLIKRSALAGTDAAAITAPDVPVRMPACHPRLREAARVQPWCNAIKAELQGLQPQGVELEFRDARFFTDTARLLAFFHGEPGAILPTISHTSIHFARLGIPMTTADSVVKIITGPRRNSPLPCNALVDLDGLYYLQSRQSGTPFDSLRIEEFEFPPVAERVPGLTGEFGEEMISFNVQRNTVRKLVDGGGRWKPISRFVMDAQVNGLTEDAGPGALQIEHEGQRFVVLPYPIWTDGAAVHLTAVLRARQFRQIITWLHQGSQPDYEFPAYVDAAYDLDVMHFRGKDRRELVALANYSMDPLEQPLLTLSAKSGQPDQLEILHEDGSWSSDGIVLERAGQYRLKNVRLEILQVVAIRYHRL